jgi:hypothetical protein
MTEFLGHLWSLWSLRFFQMKAVAAFLKAAVGHSFQLQPREFSAEGTFRLVFTWLPASQEVVAKECRLLLEIVLQ